MRTLELGQVQENDFYSHILHDDLDSIVRDIREAHLKDKTTADPQPTLDEVKENFEQAIQIGTDTEAMIHEFCEPDADSPLTRLHLRISQHLCGY